GADLHARLAHDLTAPAMRPAIDRDPALETNSHPAQRRARLAAHRPPVVIDARLRDCGRYHRPGRYTHGHAVHRKFHRIRHAPPASVRADTAPLESRTSAAEFDRPPAYRWPVTL